MQKIGCAVVGAVYGVFAFVAFGLITMGDCDTREPFHSRCETSRGQEYFGLLVLSLGVGAVLTWMFLVPPPDNDGRD